MVESGRAGARAAARWSQYQINVEVEFRVSGVLRGSWPGLAYVGSIIGIGSLCEQSRVTLMNWGTEMVQLAVFPLENDLSWGGGCVGAHQGHLGHFNPGHCEDDALG